MVPYLLYRDDDGHDRLFELDDACPRVAIGRRGGCELRLAWDPNISRVHAELLFLAGEWVVSDYGLSRNGTYVNHERVRGLRRLRDGDVIALGDTHLHYCTMDHPTATTRPRRDGVPVPVSPAQQRVLTALCRPLESGRYAAPASNRQIAAELVLSVETVKGTLSRLFALYALEGLPQNTKRSTLALRALSEIARG